MAETRAVAKALVLADNKLLLLLRNSTDTRRPLQWDLPGGSVDAGEDVKMACAREIAEEAGITVNVTDLKVTFAMTEMVTDDVSCSFLFFRVITDTTEVVLSHEHSDFRWVSLAQAQELITYKRHARVLSYVSEHDLLSAGSQD